MLSVHEALVQALAPHKPGVVKTMPVILALRYSSLVSAARTHLPGLDGLQLSAFS